MAAGPFTKEKENFLRLVLLINEKGAEAFRESLLHFSTLKYRVRTFDDVLNDVTAKTILQSLKGPGRGKPITAHQWLILYPGTGIPVEVSQLDITLCFVLLRNICNLFPPLTSWDHPPAPGDNSLEGGLAQIKSIRNFISHSKEPKLSDADFNTNFNNACDAILNIAQKLPKWSTNRIELDQFLKCSISAVQQADLEHVVKEWAQQDSDIKTELDKVNKELIGVRTDISNAGKGIGELENKIDLSFSTMKTELSENKQLVSEKLETMSSLLMKQIDLKGTGKRVILSEFAIKLQAVLKDYYQLEMSEIRCNPLDPDATQPIDDLFVELSMVTEGVNYAAGQKKEFTPLRHYIDIFEDTSTKRKTHRILVQGKPGVGKTTLTKRIAIDWAQNRIKQLSERFENVFVLVLRKVTQGQTLVDIIADQLLSQECPLVQHLKSYIENNDKCLFVFDGLDEMTPNTSQDIDNMIKRRYLRNTCLLITSRPTQAQHLTTTTKIDQHARIEGFSDKSIERFILNFFGDKLKYTCMDCDSLSYKCHKNIRRAYLDDIAKIPLILNMLCLLYRENQALPATVSQIYQRLQQLLCRRIKECEEENEIELNEIFAKLGKVAFEGLMNDNRLFFPKKKILEEVGEDAFKVGLIWIEKSKYDLEANTQAFFLHKSFQENTAAFYLGNEIDKCNDAPFEMLKSKLRTLDDIHGQRLFLQFCARASQRLADLILQFLDGIFFTIHKGLLHGLVLMEKSSNGEDLSLRELEHAYYCSLTDWGKGWDLLCLEAECLNNMEDPTNLRPHAVNYIVADIPDVQYAFMKSNLKPAENCIVSIGKNNELEQLVKIAECVSWLRLHKSFFLTDTTSELMQKMCDNNKHEISVLMDDFIAECPVLLECIRILKEHPNIKYKGIDLGKSYRTKIYTEEDWGRVFDLLLGIRALVCFGLAHCGIPSSALKIIGVIINQNADTLLRFHIYKEGCVKSNFYSLSSEIENALSLTCLHLVYCLDDSDTDAVNHLLKKCKFIKDLRIWKCPCEISNAILQLGELKNLDMSSVDLIKSGGKLDVGNVLEHLDKLQKLRTVSAFGCELVDSQVQKIPLQNMPNLKELDLKVNYIDIDINELDNPFNIEISILPRAKDIPEDDEDDYYDDEYLPGM